MTAGIKANSDGSAAIQVGGTDVITLTSGGAATFVTSPTTVQAGTAAAPSITFSGDTNTGIYSPGADQVAIATGGSKRFEVDAAGNAGLGVTPSVWQTSTVAFEVGSGTALWNPNSSNQTYLLTNASYSSSSFKYRSTATAAGYRMVGNSHEWLIAPSGTAGNAITFTQAMTLSASGNFSLGTTTEAGRAYILGDGTNVALRVAANTATTTVYASIMRHESTTAGAYIQFVTDNNVETGRIYDLAGTMQYASSSDARLKTNVQPMQNSLQSVLALNPCTFDMRRGEDTFVPSAGLIAQEVHEVYPFVVGVGGDDENTNPWSVDYGKLTPLLVAAIKEQQAMIDELKAKVAALEGA